MALASALLVGSPLACSKGSVDPGDGDGGGEPNRAPTVTITSPASGTEVREGSAVTFVASASDPEDGPLTTVVWSSSIDGSLGSGTSVAATLSPGDHRITASAADAGGRTASDEIDVRVAANRPPSVAIQTPPDGSSVEAGETVLLTATASDPEEGDLSNSIRWTSSLQGDLGTGGSVSVTLSEGAHTITAAVTDAEGLEATGSITLTVLPPAANTPPDLVIHTPSDGTTVPAGTALTFSATATDAEDGDLSGSITWTSSIDGSLGRRPDPVATLSAGTHTIQASVTDSGGLTATATIQVIVGSAGSGTISGTVSDAGTGAPLASAQVFIDALSIGTLTDAQGHYDLDAPVGTHTVEVQYVGFQPAQATVVLGAGQAVDLDFALTTTNANLCFGDGTAGGGNGPTFTPFSQAPTLTNTAEVVAAIDASYPADLRNQGIGGQVTFWFYITGAGQVREIRLHQSSGLPALDAAGCTVAKVMEFSPATNQGVPVDVWVSLPITFTP